jgi:hypothetical protein
VFKTLTQAEIWDILVFLSIREFAISVCGLFNQ